MAVTKEYKFNVIPGPNGGRIMVPGCEPTSTLTSTRMDAEMRAKGVCPSCVVDVNTILNGIPGSRIEFLDNAGPYGSRKLLALPPLDQDCPCTNIDYYQMLRDLGREATEEEVKEVLGNCDAFSLDQCENRPEWRGQL